MFFFSIINSLTLHISSLTTPINLFRKDSFLPSLYCTSLHLILLHYLIPLHFQCYFEKHWTLTCFGPYWSIISEYISCCLHKLGLAFWENCWDYSEWTECVQRTELLQSKLGQRVPVPVVLTVHCMLHIFILHVRITPALLHMQDVKILLSNPCVLEKVMYWLMMEQ